MKLPIVTFFAFGICVALLGCKKEKNQNNTPEVVEILGCTDIEATNFNSNATKNNGTCTYSTTIKNPSFETTLQTIPQTWYHNGGSGYCGSADLSNISDGFMPTNGQYFFKCIPAHNCPGPYNEGTSYIQSFISSKHFKGIYFDYSYTAIAGSDSILEASVEVSYTGYEGNGGTIYDHKWAKNLSFNAITFNGFPTVTVQKRNEYIEVPEQTGYGDIYINTRVTAGTFTFQIDNIREVPR